MLQLLHVIAEQGGCCCRRADLLGQKVVRHVDRHVHVHGLVVEVVLQRLLARSERLRYLVTRLVVRRGGELGRKLSLERAAIGKRQKGRCEYQGCDRTE